MSLRIVPASTSASSAPHVVSHQDTAHPTSGVHDTFRHGLTKSSAAVEAGNAHPLQARLEQWEATQTQLKLTMQRNLYGLGLPLRNMMDRKLCAEDNHHPSLTASSTTLGGSSNISLEILEGKDESIDVSDFMGIHNNPGEILDVSAAMEKKNKI